MRMYLIRHGATQGNLEHRYVGRTDEGILESEKGRLREKGRAIPRLDGIFVSPYLRCRQTAKAFFYNSFQEAKGQCPVEVVEGLREMDFGEFEYRNYQELSGNPEYQNFIDSGGKAGFPGGEGIEAFQSRCQEAFLQCLQKASESRWEQVGALVHGGTIMAVMERFCQPQKGYYEYQVANGCGYLLEIEGMTIKIVEDIV